MRDMGLTAAGTEQAREVLATEWQVEQDKVALCQRCKRHGLALRERIVGCQQHLWRQDRQGLEGNVVGQLPRVRGARRSKRRAPLSPWYYGCQFAVAETEPTFFRISELATLPSGET